VKDTSGCEAESLPRPINGLPALLIRRSPLLTLFNCSFFQWRWYKISIDVWKVFLPQKILIRCERSPIWGTAPLLLMAVGLFQSLVQRSGTLSRILSATDDQFRLFQTFTYLLHTSASNAFGVLDNNCAIPRLNTR